MFQILVARYVLALCPRQGRCAGLIPKVWIGVASKQEQMDIHDEEIDLPTIETQRARSEAHAPESPLFPDISRHFGFLVLTAAFLLHFSALLHQHRDRIEELIH